MTTVTEATKSLTASDGHSFDAFCAMPEAASVGGLVILQEIFGVTDQLKSVARRYAAEGFTVLVPALFDRVSRGVIVPFEEATKGRDMMLKIKPEEALLDIDASAKEADTGRGASVLGFCWGGGLALRAAIGLDLSGSVAFYGTRLGDIVGPRLNCPMQFHFGASDDHSPPEIIEAVRQKVPDAEIHVYEAGHAFANDARPAAYSIEAAERAHDRARAFLKAAHEP